MDVRQLADFAGFSEEKLQKHNLFTTGNFFLDVYCLRPGQAQRPHHHAGADKVYVVLEGACRFRVGDTEGVHGVGAAVLCPAGIEHGVENPGPLDARLLVLMSPPPSR